MRLLVTGKQGQVVQALAERAVEQNIQLQMLGRPELDLADPHAASTVMATAIKSFRPDMVVNAAAYTAVDQAEDEAEMAFAVNAASAGTMSKAAAEAEIPFIQISTDYVFDGTKIGSYLEDDTPNPKSVYGASKLAGEEAVRASNAYHLIFRTAWVYSPFGKNFVKSMLKLAESRDELRVVADQTGNPTSAFEIADGIIAAARRFESHSSSMPWGTYNLAGLEVMSWAEFAENIFAIAAKTDKPSALIIPIGTVDYPTKAKRPSNSKLSSQKFNVAFPQEGATFMHRLQHTIDRLV
jgi:dTDP-4-dehydrorhamnose reductase